MRQLMLLTVFVCTPIAVAGPFSSALATSGTETEISHLTASWRIGRNAHIARYVVTTNYEKSAKRSRPTAEEIWRGIKSAAQTEVRSNSPLIMIPKFSVQQVGSTRQLTIAKGDVGGLGFRDDPYELPFKKQILIEALRHSLTETDLTKGSAAKGDTYGGAQVSAATNGYWQPYLVRAENLVKKTVVDLESDRDKSTLREELRQDEKQIDEILYDKIYQAVDQEAQHNGYNVIYGRSAGDIKKFSVNVSTAPDGAKVWIMEGLVYRKQLITKTDPSEWPWREIVQNPVELLGGYHYRAVWPEGKRAEADIVVDNASPITLRPN